MEGHRLLFPIFWVLYALLSCIIIFYFLPPNALHTKPIVSIHDGSLASALTADIAKDHGGDHVTLTRMFHNKVLSLGHEVFISAIRVIDPIYLFSLSDRFFYGDETGVLPVWELPLFLLSIWFFFFRKLYNMRSIQITLGCVVLSDLILAFFLPRLSLIYLPFIISLHAFMGMCVSSILFKKS